MPTEVDAPATPATRSQRRAGPDQLKGLLLALVIYGHTVTGGVREDSVKWMIYGFHMPAFLFVSGYLTSSASLHRRSLVDLVRHYWKRMVSAWLIVSIAYLWFYARTDLTTTRHLVKVVALVPKYHLWYIPTLAIGLGLAWLLGRGPAGRVALAVVAVVGMLAWRTPCSRELPDRLQTSIDSRYFGYLIWLVAGFLVRNAHLRVLPVRAAIPVVSVASVLLWISIDWRGWAPVGVFVLLNIGVVSLIPPAIVALDRPIPVVGRVLVALGVSSLWVYLLHPFATRWFGRHIDGRWTLTQERLGGIALTVAIAILPWLRDQASGWADERHNSMPAGELTPVSRPR